MKNYTITEEQIKELAKGNKKVEKMFPEVFEQKILMGWNFFYWDCFPDEKRELIFLTNIDGDKVYFDYGINLIKEEWLDRRNWYSNEHIFKKATEEEVKEALIEEAKRRGFKDGVRVDAKNIGNGYYRNSLMNSNCFNFDKSLNQLCLGIYSIFKDGKWAEILKTKYITKYIAEDKLNELLNDGFEYKIID